MKGSKAPKTYLIEVSPLKKTPLQEGLSYFGSEKLIPGQIVRVNIRNQNVPGVVLSCTDAREEKANLRKARFALRKINKGDIQEVALSEALLKATKETAKYYVSSERAILENILPKIIIQEPGKFLEKAKTKKNEKETNPEPLLLQMESIERYAQYRRLIRESFARGASVLLICPTHLDVEKIKPELSFGIEEFVWSFTLKDKPSEAKKNWHKAKAEKHPILFITTPAGLAFEREDLDTLILERENSRAYRSIGSISIDWRFFIRKLAKEKKVEFISGDSILSLKTLLEYKKGLYSEESLIRWRLPLSSTKLVDTSIKADNEKRFNLFSPELKEMIESSLQNKGSIFLFGARKGLHPSTTCADCGTVLPCLNCGAPLVLHHKDETPFYLCHSCSLRQDSQTLCPNCNSWRLVPLGIGTEEIAREVKELYPETPVWILDKDYAPTESKAKKIVSEFKEEGGVLVGTELSFFYLNSLSHSAVVSLDSLFSIPDFSINERIFYLLTTLRELTEHDSLIQTRNIKKDILTLASLGNVSDFYQNEIEERESLMYPPFSVFIKLSPRPKSRPDILNEAREFLRDFEPEVFRQNLILRLKAEAWPSPLLSEKLSLLSRDFSIKVDPETIL